MLFGARAAISSTRGLERNLPAFLEVDFRNFTDYRTAKSTTLDDGRHNQTTIDRRHDRAFVGRLWGGAHAWLGADYDDIPGYHVRCNAGADAKLSCAGRFSLP